MYTSLAKACLSISENGGDGSSGYAQGNLYNQRQKTLNMSIRKVKKNRGHFPSDEAMFKSLYLALKNIAKKWTMPIRDWKSALNQFSIKFECRMSTY
jgi:transposase-like protein